MAGVADNIQDIFERSFDELISDLIEALKDEYKAQGHVLTGRLIKNIKATITQAGERMESEITLLPYARYLERGVKARNIPFSPGSGRKSSKYIDALIQYFLQRGVRPVEEAKRAAFATARKHKKEGMPTRSSFKYSKNGRRKFAIRETIEGEGDRITEDFAKRYADRVSGEIARLIAEKENI